MVVRRHGRFWGQRGLSLGCAARPQDWLGDERAVIEEYLSKQGRPLQRPQSKKNAVFGDAGILFSTAFYPIPPFCDSQHNESNPLVSY